MGFKDEVAKDVSVFLNTDEFADIHKVNGVDVPVLIDNEQLKKIQADYDGIYDGDLFVYAPATSFSKPPKPGLQLNFDNVLYVIETSDPKDGLIGILLKKSGGFSGA